MLGTEFQEILLVYNPWNGLRMVSPSITCPSAMSSEYSVLQDDSNATATTSAS